MKRIWRSIVGGCLAVATASSAHPGGQAATPTKSSSSAAVESTIAGDAFTKYKKVHLVRPDLFSYPLFNEFVC